MTQDVALMLRRAARELHKGMKPGGPQGTRKGKRGYTRKAKHPHKEAHRES